jgi:F-type H+-transporting ATPase subunit b
VNTRLLPRLASAAAALTPSLALALSDTAGGAHAGQVGEVMPTVKQGVATAVTALVVFAIVFAVLATKVWPVIVKALDERAAKIREEIEGAELARRQAKDALEQYQKSLADARAEAQKMLEATRAQQQAIAAELRAKADAELSAMRDRARKDIESAKRAAVAEIYGHAANLGTMIAGKVLQRNVSAGDTNVLVEESLRQLEAMKN